MNTLTLAPQFELPIDASTRRMAILAMSGAGKSNTAVVMAEQMFKAGIPWVAIDPKGDWWGVRAGTNGKRKGGLPIPIFGGLHKDVDLEPTSGKLIGDIIVDQRLTCVLDISEFEDRQQMWGFLIDLGNTLLRKNRKRLHLFLEEADEYLPQKTSEKGNLPKCLGVWQRVVKRGRFRGIGSTQITQRSAALNKDTLYMAELLIAMRATGPGDQDAIAGWVKHNRAAAEIVASLPELEDGEGWVSSPAWLRKTERVTFHRRHTFDSGATPVSATDGGKAATLADVDLKSLRTRMADTIARAKENDPEELKKANADLTKKLADADKRFDQAARDSAALASQVQELKARLQTSTDRSVSTNLKQELAKCRKALGAAMQFLIKVQTVNFETDPKALEDAVAAAIAKAVAPFNDRITGLVGRVEGLKKLAADAEKGVKTLLAQDIDLTVQVVKQPPFAITEPKASAAPGTRPKPAPGNPDGVKLKAGARHILSALASRAPETMTWSQLAMLVGIKTTGSTMSTYRSHLRSAAFITEVGANVSITQAGLQYFGDAAPEPMQSRAQLIEMWKGRLKKGARQILDELNATYPNGRTREELAADVLGGIDPAGSTLSTYLSHLRTAGLTEERSGRIYLHSNLGGQS